MTRPVTFVHAADLHLDAPFQGVGPDDDRVRTALVESTYRAFDRIVELCLARGVDFLVIAGDAYNSRDKSLRAQLRFRAGVERLAQAGIRVFIAQGNHDPADGWSAGLELPETVDYFPVDRVGRFEVDDEAGETLAVLYGRGYATRAVTRNLASEFRRSAQDVNAIGVLHANVGGQTDYEPYAPCSLDDLRAAHMDYWALGHIHKPLELSEDPPIRYAGSPQGLNPTEDGAHGCYVVTLDHGHGVAEFVETSQVRWAHREVDARDVATIDALQAAIARACASARAEAGGVPVVLRVDITGRSAVHAPLARAEALDDLVDAVRDAQLADSPWVWVDRVRDLTRSLIDVDAVRASSDFAGDLVREGDEILGSDASAREFLGEVLVGLADSVDVTSLDARAVVERARDLCLDHLMAEEDQ